MIYPQFLWTKARDRGLLFVTLDYTETAGCPPPSFDLKELLGKVGDGESDQDTHHP